MAVYNVYTQVIRLERVTAGYVAMCSRKTFLDQSLKESIATRKSQEKVQYGGGPSIVPIKRCHRSV